MKLSVIVPCFNETHTIESIIDAIWSSPHPDKEIIVVDDCSTDGTREKLKQIEDRIDRIILQPANRGKGAAIREGIKTANGSISCR